MNIKRFVNYLSLVFVLVFYLSCSPKLSNKLLPPPPAPLEAAPKDRDGDGVKDENDKCPDQAGPVSLFGCPDSDGDGIADNEDKCPGISGVFRYKGCPIPDTDNDGINDELDICPIIPGSASNNGCPLMEQIEINMGSSDDGVPSNKSNNPKLKGNKPNSNLVDTKKKSESIIENNGTSVVENNNNAVKKTASLGYSYYPKIKQNETKDFRVFVKINGEGKIIYQEIRSREKIEGPDDYNTDTSKIVILPYKIDLYKKLKIVLEVDSADFKIVPQAPGEQELDLVNGNHWHWNLRAVANSERIAQITMKIIAIKSEGDTVYLPSKQVNIKVAINKPDPVSFSTRIMDWLGNNIQYVVGSIITPFGVFLYGRRKKKKEEINAAKAKEKAV